MKQLVCKRCHSRLGGKEYMAGDRIKSPTAAQLKTAQINHNQWRIIEVATPAETKAEKPDKKEVKDGKPKS